jgi:predicted small lipoprotein YifL
MRKLVPVMVVLALVMALGACGDDGGSVFEGSSTTAAGSSTTAAPTTTAGPATTAASTTTAGVTTTGGGVGGHALGGLVAGALAQGAGADSPVVTGGEEECLTSGLSAAIGAERFAELDALAAGVDDMSVVFGQMTDLELDALVGVIGTCIDVEALLTEEMAGAELSPQAVACFAGTLSEEDTLKSLIRAMMTGEDPETNPEFIALMIQIMTQDCAEPMEAMLVDEFSAAGMSAESAACVADKFLRGGLFEALLNTMLSGTDFPTDPELQNQMMTAFSECLTPEELGNLGG